MSLRRRYNVLRNLALYTLEHNPRIAEGRAVLKQPAWMAVARPMLHMGDTWVAVSRQPFAAGKSFLPLDVGDIVVVEWYDMDVLYGWSTSTNQRGYFSWEAICDIANVWCDKRSEEILWVPGWELRAEWQWGCVWHRTWYEWVWIRQKDLGHT